MRLVQTKSVKMFNTNPFHHLPPASFCPARAPRRLSLFLSISGRVLGRWRATQEVIITGYCFFLFKKSTFGILFIFVCCLFSVSRLNRKVLKRRWHGSGEEDRAGLLLGGILYLGPSHAEVPCSDWSHLTSTAGERGN